MKQVLFEPWNLGDALIATAIALQAPERLALACNTRWQTLIRLATPPDSCALDLIAADLDYVNRDRKSPFSLGQLPEYTEIQSVLSIRGDLRDYVAAKRIFPKASVQVSGWAPFFARRSSLLDFPFRAGIFSVRNRYESWAKLAGVDFEGVKNFYSSRRESSSENGHVLIHVGAQWRARQFPNVMELKTARSKKGFSVKIVAGPKDALPAGITESQIGRLINQELVDALQASGRVITNDSGPMHLAALLGCRTHVVSRASNIKEWLPPGAVALKSKDSPVGYRPDSNYCTDSVLEGWPSLDEIVVSL